MERTVNEALVIYVMKCLIVVMAHAAAQSTFNRHLRFWESHGQDIVVFSPQDAVVRTKHPVIAWGTASHHDAMANERFFRMLEIISRMNYDRFCINEYDSLCFSPEIPYTEDGYLWANSWKNEDPSFSGEWYFHPPLIMCNRVLKRIVQACKDVPFSSEKGFWDRYLGIVVQKYGIGFGTYNEQGFSRNTIEIQDLPAAMNARRNGAVLFHGIKDASTLAGLEGACSL